MTTEEDFQRMLDANSGDHATRLIFADWLQDRDDPRAEGMRVLGASGRSPYHGSHQHSWYIEDNRPDEFDPHLPSNLPRDWYAKLKGQNEKGRGSSYWLSRRAAEDAAARAFAKLPVKRRVELLSMVPA